MKSALMKTGLDRALDTASRHIRAEAHDRQARSAYGHPSRFN